MGVTSGRGGKWVGARADVKPPECPENGSGWLSTMTESDWREWERKFIQDQKLKNMVETWKKGVEVTNPPVESRATKSQDSVSHSAAKDSCRPSKSRLQTEPSEKQSVPPTTLDPLKDSAPFGFNVVKRSSQTNVLNGKPDAASTKKKPYDGPELPSVSEAPEPSKGVAKGDLKRPKGQITNDAELVSDIPTSLFLISAVCFVVVYAPFLFGGPIGYIYPQTNCETYYNFSFGTIGSVVSSYPFNFISRQTSSARTSLFTCFARRPKQDEAKRPQAKKLK
jgi:hypothetical protein